MGNALQNKITLKTGKCQILPLSTLSKASELVLGAAGAAMQCRSSLLYCRA